MVQNLNNNLITAPELADLRKRLRNLETKVSDIPTYSSSGSFAVLGWPNVLRGALPIMVSQRCRYVLFMSARSSI